MSFQLAAAYVELSQRGFGTVMGGVDAIRGKLGGLVSFATGPVAAGLAALGAGASVAGMVGLAAKVEQTTAQFKTLLGSVDAARGMIENLQKFSASTPFQFDGLADSAKVLLAFGVSSEQVIPTMKTLGDVAAATGNDIGELANIYGKVKAQGTLMTDTLNQFNERGIPIGARLAEMFQKTEAEIRDMASKGQLSFGDLQRAMVGMTSEGGMAFNGMAEQSTTLGGLFSTLKDNVTLVMVDIGQAIVDGFDLKAATNNLTTFVQRVQGEWMPAIVGSFQWASSSISSVFASSTEGMLDYMIDFVANIDLSLRYFVTLSQNASINAGEHIATFFTNSVTLAGWFVSNAGSLFVNLYNHSGRIFGNMVDMMKGLWDGLWSYISGDGFTVDFMPMIDSFNAAVDGIKLPELQTPQLDQFRDQLDSIEGEFLARQIARGNKGKKQTEETGEAAMAALDIQEDTEKGITEEKQKQKELSSSFVGIAEVAQKMQDAIKFGREPGVGAGVGRDAIRPAGEVANNIGGREQMTAMQQQLNTMQAILTLASGPGIRIAQQGGGVSLPAASVQFAGATG